MALPRMPAHPADFDAFLDLSARLGQDIRRTQGAGGNTSIKDDGVMWVKASGTWLSQAKERDIMVPVRVAPLVTALREGDPRAESSVDFVVSDLNPGGLRPSIETSFHAALPQRVVAHFHCVDTIAIAVRAQRAAILAERMAGVPDLSFVTIPYRRPGVPLAREIEARAAERPDVLVLYNHGLIVCGDSVAEVAARVERVTAALAVTPAEAGKPDAAGLETLSAGSAYRPATDAASHAVALSASALRFALGGVFYPDHVIFLGSRPGLLDEAQSLEALLDGYRARGEPAPKLVLVPGRGVLLSRELTPGGEAMARCLAEVALRVPAGEDLVPLNDAEMYELSNWEAEQYRQALDRKAAGR